MITEKGKGERKGMRIRRGKDVGKGG